MRGFRSLTIITVVLLSLGAYIYFIESERPASYEEEAKDKVFAVDSDSIREIKIRSESGETTSIEKGETGTPWKLTAPLEATADSAEVTSIVTNLASLEIQRVVDESPEDLSLFGLTNPRITVAYKSEDDDFTILLIGEKTPTGTDLYAKLPEEKRVFLISGFLETTFNRTPFHLRDKTILEIDTQAVDRLEVSSTDTTIEVIKTGGRWKLTKPLVARADYGTVQGLLGRLSTAQMQSIAANSSEDLAEYGLAESDVTVTLGTGSSIAKLSFGTRTGDSKVYAQDLSRSTVFTVDTSLIDELKKLPEDYRSKDIFGFRPFNVTRFEITRNGETTIYEKKKMPEDNGEDEVNQTPVDTWQQTSPITRTIDNDKIQSALSRMSNLRVIHFTDVNVTLDLNNPSEVVAHYDEDNVDRVSFGLDEQDVYAEIANEPGQARIDTNDYNLALKAILELNSIETSETP